MIIKGEYQDPIKLSAFDDIDGLIWQGTKSLCIDKQQAQQLVEVLRQWLNGEDVQ